MNRHLKTDNPERKPKKRPLRRAALIAFPFELDLALDDNLGADSDLIIEVDHVLIGHTDAAG